MNRRLLMLEEMGLTPVWRLRSGGGRPAPSADAASPSEALIESPALPAPTSASQGSSAVRGAQAREKPSDARQSTSVEEEGRRHTILAMDWAALNDAVARCVACPLHVRRTRTVFGVGDERARWLFVGEGPGAEEDAKGEPFVGQAGRLLDNMLAAIDLTRGEDVYIANVVKCRPPNNRNPESAEMRCCEPYLARQIALIQPKLIVALGKIAASHLLRTDASIASLRGRVHDYQGTPLIVTYHPAYLLRTLPDKAKSWADLCFARETMQTLTAAGERPAT